MNDIAPIFAERPPPSQARFQAARRLLEADLRRALLGGSALAPGLFFLLAGILLALALGGKELRVVAPAGFSALALLAACLVLETLHHPDQAEGRLPLLALSPLSFSDLTLVRAGAHFLLTFPGLAVAALLLAPLWHLPAAALAPAIAALALACLSLSALAAWTSALLLGARRGALILAFLFLPLATPALVLLAAAASAAINPQPFAPPLATCLLLLAALACFTIPLAAVAGAAALKQALL